MKNLQEIKSSQQSKYDEIIKYLSQNNGYWLNNDEWDFTKEFFIGKKIYNSRYINFTSFKNNIIKNEVKYYILFSFKEKYLTSKSMLGVSYRLNPMGDFFDKYYKNISTLSSLNDDCIIKWSSFLIKNIVSTESSLQICKSKMVSLLDFIKDFYDDREETEKDIWYSKNINGVKKSATSDRIATSISFMEIPLYYREIVKTIIVQKHLNNFTIE